MMTNEELLQHFARHEEGIEGELARMVLTERSRAERLRARLNALLPDLPDEPERLAQARRVLASHGIPELVEAAEDVRDGMERIASWPHVTSNHRPNFCRRCIAQDGILVIDRALARLHGEREGEDDGQEFTSADIL